MKKKEIDLSAKNTKEQILSAYHEALEKLAAKDANRNLETGKKQSDEVEVVTKAVQNKNTDIFADLGNLKSSLIKEIDVINQRLADEFAKFDNVKHAIIIEQRYLEEVYGIHESAGALSALLIAQEEEREKFDTAMEAEKLEFE